MPGCSRVSWTAGNRGAARSAFRRLHSWWLLTLLLVMSLATVIVVVTPTSSRADVDSKTILMLHSFGIRFKPWIDYAQIIRSEISKHAHRHVEFHDHSLLNSRLKDGKSDVAFVEYLQALYTERPPDLIVAVGAPAANFVQRYRQRIFPGTPMLFTAVEARRVDYDKLTTDDTVVAAAHDFQASFENILRVLPRTKTVAVVNGASPNETFWSGELRRETASLAGRVEIKFYDGLSFEEILKDAASLPPDSAIFWHLMNVDAAGVAHEANAALSKLAEIANAPIFSYVDNFFGDATTVGGPMHSVQEGSSVAASVAVRILNGEKAGLIKTPPTKYAAPKFDWGQMRRWKISESSLPLGSTVEFRAPTMWEQYKARVLGAVALILAQAGLIGWLFRYSRQIARARDEVAILNASLEERVNRRTVDLGRARDRAEILLNEVNHRVANSLSLVASFIRLQTKSVAEQVTKDALAETEARIYAISSVHKQLYTSGDVQSVRLDEYLSGLLDQLATSTQNKREDAELQYDLEPMTLPTNTILNLGVVATELVINAFKYAYPFQRGEIRVRLKQLPNRRGELVVEDDGVGRGDDVPAKGTGLGTKIVDSMARSMGAEIQYLRRQPGTAARLVFPVPG